MIVDFYEMLGVDPHADRREIEAALSRMQPIWSAGTRNPKTKHSHQSFLDRIPALRKALLSDEATRAAYDLELAAMRRAERESALDELHRLVRLRSAKGGLTVTDRNLLRNEAARLRLRPEDLDGLIEGVTPLPEPPAPAEEPVDSALDVIDPAVRRQIRLALEHLKRRDLYHVLGLPRHATREEIVARADEERKRWMQKAQVTADKTAWLEAISYAQSHLSSESSRARYDRTLALEAEEAFEKTLDFALTSLVSLDPGTESVLQEEAGRLGLLPTRADQLLRRACRKRGVATHFDLVRNTVKPRVARAVRCRSCSAVSAIDDPDAPTASSTCRHCGRSLRWTCPACRSSHWLDQIRCGCGFGLDDLETLQRHLERARECYRSRRYQQAVEHLEQACQVAPQSVSVQRATQKVQTRLDELRRFQAAWEIERGRGRMVAARKIVDAWAKIAAPDDPALLSALTEVHARLGQAVALASQAHAAQLDDPPRARRLFLQSLELASDLPEAREGLLRCPPDPPRQLQASWNGDHVRLSWKPPPPDHLGPLSYAVFRKRGEVPSLPRDGTLLAETASTEFSDSDLEPGAHYGYAVFTTRNGIDSLTAATAGPVQALPIVTRVRTSTTRDSVAIFWNLHPSAAGATVVRKSGAPPAHLEDGQPLPASREGVEDPEVREGASYYYGIAALYREPAGGLAASRLVTVNAVPQAAVQPVESLSIASTTDGDLRLAWEPGTHRTVRILRTTRDPALSPGSRYSESDLEQMEGSWIEPGACDHAELPPSREHGIQFFTPFTRNGSSWVAGQTLRDIDLPDPADLRAARVGSEGKYNLRWRWPAQASQCLVIARRGRFPEGSDDPEALIVTVTEAEYSRRGFASITLPGQDAAPWHLAVLAIAHLEGQKVVSLGREPSSKMILPGPNPEVTVSYSLRPPRLPGRSWSLTFRTDPPDQPVPPMALVLHPRTVPLSVDDGELIDRFPASRDGATFRIRTRKPLGTHRARIFPDPHLDPDSLPPVRLQHPDAGGTRI